MGKLDADANLLARKYSGSVFIVLVHDKGLSAALAATPAEAHKMPTTLRHLADEMEVRQSPIFTPRLT